MPLLMLAPIPGAIAPRYNIRLLTETPYAPDLRLVHVLWGCILKKEDPVSMLLTGLSNAFGGEDESKVS